MSEWFCDIWIPGKPETQGSMSFFNGRATHKKTLVEWRKHVQGFVELWVGTHFGLWEPVTGPVEGRYEFYLPRAKSNKTAYPIGARSGDLDKYVRGINDAISLGEVRVIADDSQIVDSSEKKRWAHGIPGGEDGHEPGVRLRVRKVE